MKLENELILASKAYKEDLGQRLVISNIPFVGSTIDQIFTSKWTNYCERRLEIFNNCVIEELESLDENKVDYEFIDSPEFFDLIVTLIENSVKTRHIERVTLFGKLLKTQISKDNSSKYLSDDFTYLINELTPRDIIIISELGLIKSNLKIEKLSSPEPKRFNDFITVNSFLGKTEYSDNEIQFSLSKLNKLGLINEFYDGSVLGLDSGGCYKTTNSFEELINIIKS